MTVAILKRSRIADGVGDIDRGGAGLDGCGDDIAEEVELGPRGVFGTELDIGTVSSWRLTLSTAFSMIWVLRHSQLVLAVDGGSGQKDMDSRLLCELDRLPGAIDVAIVAPSQATDR